MQRYACLVFAGAAFAAGFDHSLWDRVLKKSVNAIGEVDYATVKKDRGDLDAYIARLTEASPDNRKDQFPSRAHELAYWLNAYNALVMKGVVDAWPTKSVRDLGALYGFFRRKDYTLGGQKVSLQDLENKIIRKRYNEPRIHFAIVCASISCPLLARDAFTAQNLETQLDALTRQSVAERRIVFVEPERNRITLSALFKWYGADYGDVLAFIRKHASPPLKQQIESLKNPRIQYYDYDWSINDPGSRARAKEPHERL